MNGQNQYSSNQQATIDTAPTLESPFTITSRKLDADHYTADDIDGVTESIFGSGNLAYVSLQASQTDFAISFSDAQHIDTELVPNEGTNTFFNRPDQFDNAETFIPQSDEALETPTDTDRALNISDGINLETVGTEGNFNGTTVGSLGASTLSSDAGSFSNGSNLSLGGDRNDIDNIDSNPDGDTNVNNETNVINNDIDDTVQNVVNTVNETVNNITNLGDELIENIVNLGDELIENILEGDITEITEILTNEISEIIEVLNTQINYATDIVYNTIEDILGGGISINLNTDILDTLGTDLGVTIEDSIAGTLSTDLISDNLSTLAENLTGLNIPLISDIGANIGFDLLGGVDPEDGADISVAGLNTPNISLDAIENIAGDIDIELTLPTELVTDPAAAISNLLNTVQNLDDLNLADPASALDTLGEQGVDGALDIVLGNTELGDSFDTQIDDVLNDIDEALEGISFGDIDSLLNNNNAEGTDSDITADLGIGILDTETLNKPIDLGLDIVEDLTGDIDLDIGLGTDLLSENETDNSVGDTDITIETDMALVDNTLPDITGAVDLDQIEDITGDIDLNIGLGVDIFDDFANPVVNEGEGGTGNENILSELSEIGADTTNNIIDALGDNEFENISNDLDNTIDEAIGLLDTNHTDNPVNLSAEDNESEESGWTESTIGEGGLFDDVINGIGGESDALPDPGGSVAEGIGALAVEPELDLDGLGGFLG